MLAATMSTSWSTSSRLMQRGGASRATPPRAETMAPRGPRSPLGRVLHQVVLLHDPDVGERGGARHRVRRVSVGMHRFLRAVLGEDIGQAAPRDARRQWHVSRRDALGHRHEIGHDPVALAGWYPIRFNSL